MYSGHKVDGYCIITILDTETLIFFYFFLVPAEALLRCREAKKLSRAQLWVEELQWRIKKWKQLTGYMQISAHRCDILKNWIGGLAGE